MRKLGLVAALFACVFGFCACEEEKENTPATEKEISYVLENDCSPELFGGNTDITKIVVFEFDKYGKIVDKKSVSTLRYNCEIKLYASNASVCRVDIYSFWNLNSKYYVYSRPIDEYTLNINPIYGTEITEQEYLQGVDR